MNLTLAESAARSRRLLELTLFHVALMRLAGEVGSTAFRSMIDALPCGGVGVQA